MFNWEIDEDRATNASESINSALTAIVDQKNPDIFTFIEKIKVIQTETERILVQNIRIRVWKKSQVLRSRLNKLKKDFDEATLVNDETLVKYAAACGFAMMK